MKRFKILLFALIAFVIIIPSVNASTVTYDRTSKSNLGVNKKWEITNKNRNNILNTKYVDATELVYDFADILTISEEEEMYELVKKFKEDTGFELVFVSDDFAYTNDSDNTVYARDFYDYNDFGLENTAGNYAGIVIFRNAYSYDRYTKFWVVGDAQWYAKENLNELTNSLRAGFSSDDYVQGVSDFIDQFTYYIDHDITCHSSYTMDDMGNLIHKFRPNFMVVGLVPIIITAIYIGVNVSKNKMIIKATEAQDYLVKDSVKISTKNDVFIRSHTTSYTTSSSSGGGGGHSSSGGGGCGGGGHF